MYHINSSRACLHHTFKSEIFACLVVWKLLTYNTKTRCRLNASYTFMFLSTCKLAIYRCVKKGSSIFFNTFQLMFEKFSALGLNVSLTSTLGLYASGRHCAIVVEIGDGVTSVAPMKGGAYSVLENILRFLHGVRCSFS